MTTPANWFADPTGRNEMRYWNGDQWTEHVSNRGAVARDPIELSDAQGDADRAKSEDVAGTGAEVELTADVTPGLAQAEARQEPSALEPQERRGPKSEEPQFSRETDPAKPATDESLPDLTQSEDREEGETDTTIPRPTVLDTSPTFFNAKAVAQTALDELRTLFDRAQRMSETLSTQSRAIARFGLEDVVEREAQIDSLRSELTQIEDDLARLRSEVAATEKELVATRQQVEMQSLGLFDFEHPAESSAVLADELARLRAEIRQMNKIGYATTMNENWTVNGSAAEGKKMSKGIARLMLRAYNAEAENCIKTVKAGNLHTAQARLQKAVEAVHKNGVIIGLEITHKFHKLRLEELALASQHLQTVQAERELERERKAELREQAKAAAELKREHDRLEKERSHYLNSIAALEAKGDAEGAERLRGELASIDRAIDDVDYRAANIRAGYVYVISNLGAFGEELVKIGMTRRLDPMDRVRELGDASVPFQFDVHALFFSKDAVAVEAMLHRHFADQRINKINARKEFFRVKPAAVLEVLKDNDVEVIEFDPEQKAEQFRLSWPDMALGADRTI